jgi:hypothetical protein
MSYAFGGLTLANVGDIVTMTSVSSNFELVVQHSASATAPVLPKVGQTWYDTSTLTMKQWNGTTWSSIGGGAATGTGAPNGATPGASTLGAMYADTTSVPNQIYISNGAGVWKKAAVTTSVTGSAPLLPNTGDFWYDSVNTGRTYVWNGTAWVDSSPAAGTAVATTGAGVPTGATSGANSAGAMYINNAVSPNALYVSNGAGVWTLAGDGASGTLDALTDVDTTGKVTLQSALMWDATAVSGGVTGQWIVNQIYDASPTGGVSNDF